MGRWAQATRAGGAQPTAVYPTITATSWVLDLGFWKLTWAAAVDPVRWDIETQIDGGVWQPGQTVSVGGTLRFWTSATASPGPDMRGRIRAYTAAGFGSWTNWLELP
jgi:hypothetical protein